MPFKESAIGPGSDMMSVSFIVDRQSLIGWYSRSGWIKTARQAKTTHDRRSTINDRRIHFSISPKSPTFAAQLIFLPKSGK
jgi:hypothetical protein